MSDVDSPRLRIFLISESQGLCIVILLLGSFSSPYQEINSTRKVEGILTSPLTSGASLRRFLTSFLALTIDWKDPQNTLKASILRVVDHREVIQISEPSKE